MAQIIRPSTGTGLRVASTGKTLNLQVMYMKGVDDKAFNTPDPTKDYNYSGGFVELDYAALLNNRLIVSGIFNWITPPSYDPGHELRAYSGLFRYYLGHWSAVNIAIHTEYTYHVTGSSDTFNENMFLLGLDFAF